MNTGNQAARFRRGSHARFRRRAAAADGASKDEAVAMVKKAVAFIKEQGNDKAYPEITNKAGKFIDRDLYVVVYSSTARCAHTAPTKSSSART